MFNGIVAARFNKSIGTCAAIISIFTVAAFKCGIRENIVSLCKKYNAELIEIPYTKNDGVQKIDKQMREKLSMPEFRRGRLRKVLNMIPIVKACEVHSGLTGLIAEKTVVVEDEVIDQFDAMWISSL